MSLRQSIVIALWTDDRTAGSTEQFAAENDGYVGEIGCAAQKLHEWVKNAEVDIRGGMVDTFYHPTTSLHSINFR